MEPSFEGNPSIEKRAASSPLKHTETSVASVPGLGAIATIEPFSSKENTFDFDAEIKKAEVVDYDKEGFVSLRIDDHDSPLAKQALEFEQEIWDKKDYGSLDEYNEKYLDQTRLYASFKEGKCIGTTRVFSGKNDGSEKMAPFIADMSYYDEELQDILRNSYKAGEVEELATSASENLNTRNVIRSLWRLAYRDSVERGVAQWGIIMEPSRARVLNRVYGVEFIQKGKEIDYQGGMCAPHTLNLETIDLYMGKNKPNLFDWFVKQELNTSF